MHKVRNMININDKLKRTNQSVSNYSINNTNFSVTEIENAERKPSIFNANIRLLDKKSKSYNWEYLGKLRIQRQIGSGAGSKKFWTSRRCGVGGLATIRRAGPAISNIRCLRSRRTIITLRRCLIRTFQIL